METKHRAWGIAAFAALLFAGLMASGAQCGIPGLPGSKKGMKVAKVKELDSIIVKTKEDSALTPAEYQTVVLEGVGLPSAFDNKAREGMGRALTEMVEGKYVTLEYDTPGQPWWTGNGEMVAYVFIAGKMVNEELIRQGLGRYGGQWGAKRYQARLKAAEQEAKKERRGMWANYVEKPENPGRDDYADDDYDRGSDQDYDRDSDQGEVNVYEQRFDNDYDR